MTISYRHYQIASHDAVEEHWESGEARWPMIVLPTGCGKTFTALELVARCMDGGGRVLWLAHRGELLTQPLRSLKKGWPHHGRFAGIVKASRNDSRCRCVFGSFDTLKKKSRMAELLSHGDFDLVVVDEAHHAPAATYRRVIRSAKGGRVLGLTATPHREDGKDLGDDWDIVYSYPVTDAIKEGYLVPPMAAHLQIPEVDAKSLAMLDDDAQGAALIAAQVVSHTVEALTTEAHLATALPARKSSPSAYIDPRPRRWFVFTASVEQARLTAEALAAAGVRARHASGETSPDERAGLLAALSAGRLDVLCSPMIFTEGTDCPAVDGILLARSCAAWSTYVQCVGRGLRLFEGKTDCLLLDLVGASQVHDLRSAPVLIGGSRCSEALNGVHEFEPYREVQGKCTHCGKVIACFANKGPHTWGKDHRCKACGTLQCPDSPTGGHMWVRVDDGIQVCTKCKAETRVRSPSIPKLRKESFKARWIRVPYITPETWGIRAGEHGTVLIQPDREAGQAMAYWIRYRGRKVRRLTNEPVPMEDVRAYADDVVRRAGKLLQRDAQWRDKRLTDGFRRRLEYDGVDHRRFTRMGEATDALTAHVVKEKALKLGLAEETEEQWP